MDYKSLMFEHHATEMLNVCAEEVEFTFNALDADGWQFIASVGTVAIFRRLKGSQNETGKIGN